MMVLFFQKSYQSQWVSGLSCISHLKGHLVPREAERERSHILQNNLKYKTRAGETVQQLRPLIAFVKDLDSVLSTYMPAQLPITRVPDNQMLSSVHLGIYIACSVQINTQVHIQACMHSHTHTTTTQHIANTCFKNVHQDQNLDYILTINTNLSKQIPNYLIVLVCNEPNM